MVLQITRLHVKHLTPQGSQSRSSGPLLNWAPHTAGKQLSTDTGQFSGIQDSFSPQEDIEKPCRRRKENISLSAPAHLQHIAA